MYTSKTPEWFTPKPFFDELDREFHFTLDVCATPENAKCKRYFTKEDDGLTASWGNENNPEVCFMNPPYGRVIGAWVKKASESARGGATVVCLLPARTDTKWFHDYIYNKAEIRFVKGRIYFDNSEGAGDRAPFPSMLVIFRP